jgi:hypothetical protein
MSISTTGKALLQMLETDVLENFGPPILEYLQSIHANPDPIKTAGNFAKLTGGLIAAVPAAEIELAQQISGVLITKLQSLMSKATTAVNAQATATPASTPA